jgi:hypothetical protein
MPVVVEIAFLLMIAAGCSGFLSPMRIRRFVAFRNNFSPGKGRARIHSLIGMVLSCQKGGLLIQGMRIYSVYGPVVLFALLLGLMCSGDKNSGNVRVRLNFK